MTDILKKFSFNMQRFNLFSEISNYLNDVFLRYLKFTRSHPPASLPANLFSFSEKFQFLLNNKEFDFKKWFDKQPLLFDESGLPDYPGTCFYVLNCLQELTPNNTDSLGRFQYTNSFQQYFDCTGENLVNQYFDKMCENEPALRELKKSEKPSRYFISHDNDVLFGSLVEDGLYAIKKGRFDIVLRLIANEIMQKPDWFNLEKIMDINDEYDVKSTFFWLVNKGAADRRLTGGRKIDNADYRYTSKKIQRSVASIRLRGFENGLHKSISTDSFEIEIEKLGFYPVANRNHFLRLHLPEHFEQLDAAKIQLDFSLGFAENVGFRNGYSLPFHPFNLKTGKPFNVLIIPLEIMDATAWTYLKISPKEAGRRILEFLEYHKTGSIISILWHNKYFTHYKFNGYLEVYKSILGFMKQNGINSISQEELLRL